ncbi:helix-turn-helix domain-containing protein [Blastochloris tepida]|uniref:HTH cro/C1-type domain-containing protein n=1 Tax=Blastochloris tepida TaxID=2233851 RepID=A0A348G031_9HYPH|nr:helix-turn-helix transcriptional regulator [Blastochloris tepida]BBF92914.1 hypothetical protein BLTE_15990 [Blastochloris tepida]
MPATENPDVVDTLRRVMEIRKVKMTALAERVGIPYRSLQNYLYKKSPLPLDVFMKICSSLDITPEWVFSGRFHVDTHALRDALREVFGDLLEGFWFDDNVELKFNPLHKASDMAEGPRTVGTLAVLLAGAYDVAREARALRPEDDDT